MLKLFTKKRYWILLICFLALVSLFIFIPSVSQSAKNISIKVLSFPVEWFRQLSQPIRSKSELASQNKALIEKVAELSLERDQLMYIKKENERLRELLKFKKRIGFETISAEIIARDPNDWVGSFVIDKGSLDGVEKGSAVCSAEGLLGKVVDTGDRTSSVMLLTHPSFKTGAALEDMRTNGVVVGSSRGMARMLYIPIDAEVKEGAVVVTSSYSRVFPKGITVGRIVAVEKSKTGLYKSALIKPSANSLDQEEVLCIK